MVTYSVRSGVWFGAQSRHRVSSVYKKKCIIQPIFTSLCANQCHCTFVTNLVWDNLCWLEKWRELGSSVVLSHVCMYVPTHTAAYASAHTIASKLLAHNIANARRVSTIHLGRTAKPAQTVCMIGKAHIAISRFTLILYPQSGSGT